MDKRHHPTQGNKFTCYDNVKEGDKFKLHWSSHFQYEIYKTTLNDIILLKQKRIITHVVRIIDNMIYDDGEDIKYKYYRNVCCLKRVRLEVKMFLGKSSYNQGYTSLIKDELKMNDTDYNNWASNKLKELGL